MSGQLIMAEQAPTNASEFLLWARKKVGQLRFDADVLEDTIAEFEFVSRYPAPPAAEEGK